MVSKKKGYWATIFSSTSYQWGEDIYDFILGGWPRQVDADFQCQISLCLEQTCNLAIPSQGMNVLKFIFMGLQLLEKT